MCLDCCIFEWFFSISKLNPQAHWAKLFIRVFVFLCWYFSLKDTYQKMVTNYIFSFSSASFTCLKKLSSNQRKLQHVPRIRVRVFIIQAFQCTICVHYSNCIVPYIRVERNILNLIIREVKSSIFNTPIAKLLKYQFCFHGRDEHLCDSWRSNHAICVLKISEFLYLILQKFLRYISIIYVSYHSSIMFCNIRTSCL